MQNDVVELGQRLGHAIQALRLSHSAQEETLRTQLGTAASEIELLRSTTTSMQERITQLEARGPWDELMSALQQAQAVAERRSQETTRAMLELGSSISELQRQFTALTNDAAGREVRAEEVLRRLAAQADVMAGETEAVGARQEGIRTELDELSKYVERCRRRSHTHEMALREMGGLGYKPLDIMASIALMQEQVKEAISPLWTVEVGPAHSSPSSPHRSSRAQRPISMSHRSRESRPRHPHKLPMAETWDDLLGLSDSSVPCSLASDSEEASGTREPFSFRPDVSRRMPRSPHSTAAQRMDRAPARSAPQSRAVSVASASGHPPVKHRYTGMGSIGRRRVASLDWQWG